MDTLNKTIIELIQMGFSFKIITRSDTSVSIIITSNNTLNLSDFIQLLKFGFQLNCDGNLQTDFHKEEN